MKLDAQLEVPYAKTKPLPAPFAGFCAHKWSPRLQQGATALAELQAGGIFLRGGTIGEGPIPGTDKRCILCLQARGNSPGPIAAESVVHVLGECPSLHDLREKFLAKRRRERRGETKEATPQRVAVWILKDNVDTTRVTVRREAAEFAIGIMERSAVARRVLKIW